MDEIKPELKVPTNKLIGTIYPLIGNDLFEGAS